MKDTFIHYSINNKIYKHKENDDSIVKYKKYKTIRGAQNFMEKCGYKPVAIDDKVGRIYLNNKIQKANKKKK